MLDSSFFELSLEQQFEMRRLHQELQDLDRDQALEMLLQTAEQLMLKDNMIRDLMKKTFI